MNDEAQSEGKKFKEPEHTQLQNFASKYDFSGAILDFTDKPDLIVHTNNGLLGIEHTQLFRVEAGSDGIIPQAQEALQNKLMYTARQEFERQFGRQFYVHASFSHQPEFALTKNSLALAVSKLLNLVTHAFESSEYYGNSEMDLEKWDYNFRFPGLFPQQIDRIWIHTEVVKDVGLWGVVRGGFVPDVSHDYLQKRINDKEQKVESYRTRCSEVWLVMVTESGAPSSFFNIPDEVAELTYQSTFDRVFYFEDFKRKLVELRIA